MDELAGTESSWQKYAAKCIEETAQHLPAVVKKQICEFSAGNINYDSVSDIYKKSRKIMRQK